MFINILWHSNNNFREFSLQIFFCVHIGFLNTTQITQQLADLDNNMGTFNLFKHNGAISNIARISKEAVFQTV